MTTAPIPPKENDPVSASFFANLIAWIKQSVMPRGDLRTIEVHGNVISAIPPIPPDGLQLSAQNKSSQTLRRGFVASVISVASEYGIPRAEIDAYKAGDENKYMLCILAEEIAGNGSGQIILSGYALANVDAGTGSFAIPRVGGTLQPATSGPFRLLATPTQTNLCPVMLAAASGASAEYNGYFKVIEIPADGKNPARIKIINGANPDSWLAGQTDIGDVASVVMDKKSELTIYLVAKYTDKYTLSFTTEYQSPDKAFFIIASIQSGKISQQWTDGVIYFGSRYII